MSVQAPLEDYLAAAGKAFRELPAQAPVAQGVLLQREMEWAQAQLDVRARWEGTAAEQIHRRAAAVGRAWREGAPQLDAIGRAA